MSNAERLILVTGATGNQGGAVARHLLQRGFCIRALTRNTEKPAATALARKGAEIMQGDLNDRASIDRAVDGVYGIFSVQTFWEGGLEAEVQQGKRLADAAQAAGVQHLVYSSVGSADRQTAIPHFDSKWAIEEHIRAVGLPHTILRPVFFMQNWGLFSREAILGGTLAQPLDPDIPLQQISVDDIGAFAAMAFADPDEWLGREVELAGDERTMPEVADLFSRILGRPVHYFQVPWDQFRQAAGEEMTVMYEWFNTVGYAVDIAALRRVYPPLADLEHVLRSEQWV
ncbi:MAG: NmrA/HSCARG family protein [Rhodothermales bacterium]